MLNAEKDVHIYLDEGTTNSMVDGRAEASDAQEPEGAVFSKDDLVIHGPGQLTVNAGYADGIVSKDDLVIQNGVFDITAADDGIRGKDSTEIEAGCITISAGGDGIKSTNDSDDSKGYVLFDWGALQIDADGDGISAVTSATVNGGLMLITTAGGHTHTISDSLSAKGIKANEISIVDGTFDIDVAEDGVHSDVDSTIQGGTFEVAAGDDAFHAEEDLTFDGGTVTISASCEGLEAAYVTVNDGTFLITSSDDGLNCAGGDGSGGPFPSGGDYMMTINGGYLAVYASGDGLDSNGSIEINGGTTLVHGPTSNNNGAFDKGDFGNYYIAINGGIVAAAGSSGMAIGADSVSTQYSVLVKLTSEQQANKIFHIETSGGTEVLTFAPSKKYQSVVFSTPDLATGSHKIFLGGSSTGTESDGLYTGGTYTQGSEYTTFNIQSVTTTVGSSGPPGPGGP